MPDEPDTTNFDRSRAELFDALGHPTRIKILHTLEDGPLGFSELRRRVGLESSGHLQFHLGKLNGLVRNEASGEYSLTDDGREALRVIGAERGSPTSSSKDSSQKVTISRAVLAGLVAAVILVAAFAGVLYWQSSSSLNVERQQVANLTQQVTNLTQQLQQSQQVEQAWGNVTLAGKPYDFVVIPSKVIGEGTNTSLDGVTFEFMPPVFPYSCNMTADIYSNASFTCGPFIPGNGVGVTVNNNIIFYLYNVTTFVTYFSPTVLVNFPDGEIEMLFSGWPFNPPAGLTPYYTPSSMGSGTLWLTEHTGPQAGFEMNTTSSTVSLYVSLP